MQDKGVRLAPEIANDEFDPMGHQAGDEMHVPRQPVELGNQDRRLCFACRLERRGELRSALQRIGTLARLNLLVYRCYLEVLGRGKAPNRGTLRFEAEPRPSLSGGAYPNVT